MKKKLRWELYIIQTKSGNLYTGITTDLDRRFQDHLKGKKGARFFRISDPEKIVYRESHSNRSRATKREIEIKKMSRQEKIKVLQLDLTKEHRPKQEPSSLRRSGPLE